MKNCPIPARLDAMRYGDLLHLTDDQGQPLSILCTDTGWRVTLLIHGRWTATEHHAATAHEAAGVLSALGVDEEAFAGAWRLSAAGQPLLFA